jgi:hypothetical protein
MFLKQRSPLAPARDDARSGPILSDSSVKHPNPGARAADRHSTPHLNQKWTLTNHGSRLCCGRLQIPRRDFRILSATHGAVARRQIITFATWRSHSSMLHHPVPRFSDIAENR